MNNQNQKSRTVAQCECQQFIDEFGNIGAKWFADGKTFEQARQMHKAHLKAENEDLRRRLAAAGVGENEDGED